MSDAVEITEGDVLREKLSRRMADLIKWHECQACERMRERCLAIAQAERVKAQTILDDGDFSPEDGVGVAEDIIAAIKTLKVK